MSATRSSEKTSPFDMPGMGRDVASVRQRIEALERLMEGMVTLPGTRQRMGLDAILGLVPIIGDLASAAIGAWIVWEARNLGMSKFQLARMATNVGVDTAIGAIPLVGDAFDFFFRSNSRNLRIIKRHLDRHHPATAVIDL
ncbi:MAG TPA: DUF4112 domain-containing protein [Sphingobium sp.]